MQKQSVLQLIDEKLAQIEEAEAKNRLSGNLNFGLHLHLYRQSPYLPAFLKKRKMLRRLIWLESFLLPLLIILWQSDVWDKLAADTLRTVLMIATTVFFVGLVLVYIAIHSLVVQANSAQKEVKKMMLHDLRQKIEVLPES